MMLARPSTSILVALTTALGMFLAAPDASAQFRCPPGFMRNRFGRCVPFGRQAVCPPGSFYSRGVCVSRGVRPAVCPPGWFFFRGRCRPR